MQINKLKDMELPSVDLVKRGANQRADIKLFKSDDVQNDDDTVITKAVQLIKQLLTKSTPENDPETITKADVIEESNYYCDYLSKSIESIISDDSIDTETKTAEINKSIGEFSVFMKSAADMWANGTSVLHHPDVEAMLNDAEEVVKKEFEKEGVKEMSKNNLTPEEMAIYKKLQAKMNGENPEDPEVEKSVPQNEPTKKEDDNIGKSADDGVAKSDNKIEKADLPEFVRETLAKSEAFIEKMELKEMEEVAKKYEPLGQKTEDLAKQLSDLKKSNEAMYNTTIAMFDNQLAMIEKSGLFTEIGKSGVQDDGKSAIAKAEGMAAEIMKSNPTTTKEQAMAQVWESHPDLLEEAMN